METQEQEALVHLRHELRTPVNHILGYSELLIDDAGERHLQAYVPAFRQIQSGGRQLLESIQTTLADQNGCANNSDLDAFKKHLLGVSVDVLETSNAVLENLEYGHRQTVADLDAISWALNRLIEFAGDDNPLLGKKSTIPVYRAAGASPEGVLRGHKKPGGRILIADDEPGNRDLLRRRLEFEGHQVSEAENGLEVLAILREQACDLVLLDILMPELNGFQTLAKLKQEPRLRELPVIMISALDELESVVRCIEMGADDYLSKPFNRVLLRARIAASLDKKWLRDRERCKTDELKQALRLLERAQELLAVQASQDVLTGLANRRSVESHLEFRCRREIPFSVIYIDLNGFKKINDTYGHQAGDSLLKQVGDRLSLAFRSSDILGRWGGDEFVALVDAGSADAQVHISRITDVFSKEFAISSGESAQQVSVGAAVGVADWRPGETVAEILQRADAEMYEQKLRNATSRGLVSCHLLFSPEYPILACAKNGAARYSMKRRGDFA
jgi:diguanylate cyclase (GGDEF)-like protein